MVFSQNLTGTWEGKAFGTPYLKLVILQIGDSCFGYAYDTGLGHCTSNFSGIFTAASQKLKGTGVNFIEKTFFHDLSDYDLHYSKNGSDEYLKGRMAPKRKSDKIMSFGFSISATLHKTGNSIDTTDFMTLKINNHSVSIADSALLTIIPANHDSAAVASMNEDSTISKKKNRISQLVKTIYTDRDTIQLILYDNGEIDGDIVSVFDNNKLIVNKLALSSKPFETLLVFRHSDKLHVIEVVAENLGNIPPNTAYLRIIAGNEKYELKAPSDLQNNAKIIIEYKQK